MQNDKLNLKARYLEALGFMVHKKEIFQMMLLIFAGNWQLAFYQGKRKGFPGSQFQIWANWLDP